MNYEYLPNPGKPVLILAHAFATDMSFFDDNIESLSQVFSILRYDLRGHGKSPVVDLPYWGEDLAGDVIALMDHLRIKEAYFCGVSGPGYLAQYLAIHHADRIKKIVITNAGYNTHNEADQKRLSGFLLQIARFGAKSVSQGLLDFYFTPAFKQINPERVAAIKKVMDSTPDEGVINFLYFVLMGSDFSKSIADIKMPVLILGGDEDPTLKGEIGTFMNQQMKGSQFKILPGAHAINIESAVLFNQELISFLK